MEPNDTLRWWEKVPLALLMAAQALVVFRWYAGEGLPSTVQSAMPWITTLFAIAAAIALDLVVVTTTMGRREGRESIYGMLTAASAAAFSAMVALDVYGVFPFGAWLHAAYPIVTFIYAQHLAVRVNAPHQDAISDSIDAVSNSINAQNQIYDNLIADLRENMVTLGGRIDALQEPAKAPQFACPHCGSELASQGKMAAASRWGYCEHCKPIGSNGNGHTDENLTEAEVLA